STQPSGMNSVLAGARSLTPVQDFDPCFVVGKIEKLGVDWQMVPVPWPPFFNWVPLPTLGPFDMSSDFDQGYALATLTVADKTSWDPDGCEDPSHWAGM